MKEIPWYIKYGWALVFICFTIYVGILLYVTWPVTYITGNGLDKTGLFGDSFGALTALFSGLAFWAALYILKIQNIEFSELVKKSHANNLIQRCQLQPRISIKQFTYEEHAEIFTPRESDLHNIANQLENKNDKFFDFDKGKSIFIQCLTSNRGKLFFNLRFLLNDSSGSVDTYEYEDNENFTLIRRFMKLDLARIQSECQKHKKHGCRIYYVYEDVTSLSVALEFSLKGNDKTGFSIYQSDVLYLDDVCTSKTHAGLKDLFARQREEI